MKRHLRVTKTEALILLLDHGNAAVLIKVLKECRQGG